MIRIPILDHKNIHMKQGILRTAILSLAVLFSTQLSAIQPVKKTTKINDDNISIILDEMSMSEILASSNKEIQKKTATKLSFRDKVFLFTHKGKIQKAKKAGADEAALKSMMEHSSKEFSLIAFLLGFFLSLIGVLIAYIFMKNSKAKSSWYGLLTSAIIGLLAFIRR